MCAELLVFLERPDSAHRRIAGSQVLPFTCEKVSNVLWNFLTSLLFFLSGFVLMRIPLTEQKASDAKTRNKIHEEKTSR
jgi:hypothetical protein